MIAHSRLLLVIVGLVVAAVSLANAASEAPPIADVALDLAHIHKWDNSNGDTWDPFWADDDQLYAFNCDGRGFGKKGQGRNLAFNRLAGSSLSDLQGSMINTMDAYGKSGAKKPDGATWKALGQECVDSVFYAFVSRHVYGKESHDNWLRQTAVNASLIESTDHGLSWTRSEKENYEHPMFPGARFGAPYFFHYGKNGGAVTEDGADRYVYAISSDGFWNDGDHYFLGRVARGKIAALNAGDWTFYRGGNGDDDSSWASDLAGARPVLSRLHQCSVTAPCYVAALHRYLMVLGFNPQKMEKWYRPAEMHYDFYESPHPWGPWSFVKSFSDDFLLSGHMYGPSLCARFQEQVGDGVRVILFHSGFPFGDRPGALYKMWEIPVIVSTRVSSPATVIAANDPRIHYDGVWTAAPLPTTQPTTTAPNDGTRQSSRDGDRASIEFTGTGIDYLAREGHGDGSAEVSLDEDAPITVNLDLTNFPPMQHVVVFSKHDLAPGQHHLTIAATSSAAITIEKFNLYDNK